MLKLEKIKKIYKLGDNKVEALKDLSIEFRKSEFVSILGPSGCGKTTLLNIIGGLDRYTSGNLIINGKSTKDFKDKDWDTYRNHSVGFVFQSYNLIPHQSVLENVEIALTLSGVSKDERKKRAIKVLEKVGLKSKIHSKPSQLSGGQMQRVAIARALVNDPEIILADEPTGALDSKTSVQIMELLKEISKDRLIIMVTHNPNLAKKYSSRIVKLLDGKLISDDKPFEAKDDDQKDALLSMTDDKSLSKQELKKKNKKKRMSFFTALSLSFKNLLTKKGRTILVSFAGSIGIIGIALILAISSGFNTYINKKQEDTLSSYPITIDAKSIDFSTVLFSLMSPIDESTNSNHNNDYIYPKDRISRILDTIGANAKPNNLNKFYHYIEEHKNELASYTSAIKYSYDIGLEFYNKSSSYNTNLMVQPKSSALYRMIMMYSIVFFETNANVDIVEIDANNFVYNVIYKENETVDQLVYGYLGIEKGNELKTTGHIEINEEIILGAINNLLKGTIDLNDYKTSKIDAFYEMIDDDLSLESCELIAGKMPEENNEVLLVLDSNNELDDYILYAMGLIDNNQMKQIIKNHLPNTSQEVVKTDYDSVLSKGEYTVLTKIDYYKHDGDNNYYHISSNTATYNENLNEIYTGSTNSVKISGIVRIKKDSSTSWLSPGIAYKKAFTDDMVNYINNSPVAQKDDDLGKSLKIELDTPNRIEIYVNTFSSKDKIKAFVEEYNAQAQEGDEISYSDMVGTIMSTVSTIITAITYVLIAFVSVSLVVSSIMIGIITYISVFERTKEIGVLRSVGASKKDIKRVFTAESFIIGLTSGVFGILISAILIIPINLILQSYTNIAHLASLPIVGSLILIAISIVLTLIAGLIPSKAAAKKDPVVALREN